MAVSVPPQLCGKIWIMWNLWEERDKQWMLLFIHCIINSNRETISALISSLAQSFRQWHCRDKPNHPSTPDQSTAGNETHSCTCCYPSEAWPTTSEGREVPSQIHSKSPKVHIMIIKARHNNRFSVNGNFVYNYLHDQNPIGFNRSL